MNAQAERVARRLAWALAAVLALSVAVRVAGPGGDIDLPHRFDTPSLALEAAHSLEEVQAVTGPAGGKVWRSFRVQTYADFLFLTAYAAALFYSGRLLSLRGSRWLVLGWAASALGVVAALADAGENIGLLTSVSNPVLYIEWLFLFTRLKWACFGLSCAAAAPLWMPHLPWDRQLKVFAWIAALSLLMTAGLCLIGVFNPVFWERLSAPLALGWLIPALILWSRRREYIALL